MNQLDKESLKGKTINGIVWSAVERFSVQGIQFVFQIIMARLLLPSDYGIIGMLAIFMAISQSFIDSGFSNALIRKTNRTEVDYSTVFYFNIAVGLFFYLLFFFASPYIASFYDMPILESVTKVFGITLFLNSLAVVQRAKMTVKVDFKTQAKASLIAVIVSGVVGVVMAYYGYGVWALVIQALFSAGMSVVLLWLFSKWKPGSSFSWHSFRELFSFGSKLLISGLINTMYSNIYTLVIGKKFAATELGCFTRADQFAQFPSSNLTGIFQRVTYPILSAIQDDDERLRRIYRKYLCLSAYLIFPLMVGLAAVSSPFINLVLTEKWEGVVILLQIVCFSYMWYPVHAINLNLLQVKGRSDLFLKLEIIKKIVGVVILVFTIPLGVAAMCLGAVVASLIGLFINTYYTGKLIRVGFLIQMKDLFPALFYSLSMGALVYFLIGFIENDWLQLFFGIVTGAIYYMGISYVTHSKELRDLLLLAKHR